MICAKCRGQDCTVGKTCKECSTWENKQWKILKSHLEGIERDRNREASSRAIKHSQSLETTPKPSLEVSSVTLPSTPLPAVSPIPCPAIDQPSPPLPGSLAYDPNVIAGLESRCDKKLNLVVSTVAELGASIQAIVQKVFTEKLQSDSAVQMKEVAIHPVGSSRPRSLSCSTKPGRRHTKSPREADEVCPRVVAPSATPVAHSQVLADSHWKGLSKDIRLLSSSSSDDYGVDRKRRKRYLDSSRPLKRPSENLGQRPDPLPVKRYKQTASSPRPSCSYSVDHSVPGPVHQHPPVSPWDSLGALSPERPHLAPKLPAPTTKHPAPASKRPAPASKRPAPHPEHLAPTPEGPSPALECAPPNRERLVPTHGRPSPALECPVPAHERPSRSPTPPPVRPPATSPSPLDSDKSAVARIKQQLAQIMDLMKKAPSTPKPAQDDHLSPTLEEEIDQEPASPSAYAALLRYLLANYPSYFAPAPPSLPASTFLMVKQPDHRTLLPKLVLSPAAHKSFKKMGNWLSARREQGKVSFAFPPSCLVRKRYLSYMTGEAPSMGVSACSQGDFSILIDSSHRSSSSAKIVFSSTELDHLVKEMFKVFEVLSFLDWVVGALAKKIEDHKDLASDITSNWIGVLSCADKAVRDGSLELSALITFGVLKKREVWCSFTNEGLTQPQKSALMFSPLDKNHLFPQDTVKGIASSLEKMMTLDLLTQSSRSPEDASHFQARTTSPLQQQPLRGRRSRMTFRSHTNVRSAYRTFKKRSSKKK
ncbi:uncharacterized protein [Macrobrachium rosenbergii]|uniref:uncharacterized protein n=1 Tax=Macrobrachium rosenbergii TaxID=79674 RepID=UPI0034D5967F